MTDKKTIRDQQAEIDKLKQELQEVDKLKQELQERDAAEQERAAQRQVHQIEIDNLREQHEEAMNVIAKLNARVTPTITPTDLGDADASKPLLPMDEIVTRMQLKIKNASNTDADSDSGTESDSSYIGTTSDTYDPDEFTGYCGWIHGHSTTIAQWKTGSKQIKIILQQQAGRYDTFKRSRGIS